MRHLVFLIIITISFFSYSMQRQKVLLLQSKQQVRKNNAREVADACKNFFEVVLPLYPELDKDECEQFVKIMRESEISRGKKRRMLPWLEMATKHPWALPVVDAPSVADEMSLNKKLPKKRRIN